MKTKVLLTGSLGFIASSLIRKAAFEKENYSFAGIDKASNSKQLNNIYNGKIISNNYLADITDPHIIDNIFQLEKPEIIIHGASYSNPSNTTDEIKKIFDTNVIGTKILLDSAIKHNVQKIIYLSSDNLYPLIDNNSDHRFAENDNTSPTSLMQISQSAAERIILDSDINHNILRISNVYGPRQDIKNLVPQTIYNILNNKKIEINGDGSQVLDWTHVFDVSSAILTVLKNNLNNQTINVSSGQECSIMELVHFICNSMKGGYELIYCNAYNKYNHKKHAADNSKLINLGWKPNFKLRQGIQETCDWYNLNQYYLK